MADIKEKIKKLLSLGTSTNENEARDALLKAKELMAKNKLTEADFEEVKDQELKKVLCSNISWTTDSGRVWMARLCKILCDNYLCSAAWYIPERTRTHQLMIIGIGEDVDVCREVVEYAVGFVDNAINVLQRRYHRQDPKSIANSYAEGFMLGLEMAFEEQKEDHPEWGLVVVKPDEVSDFEKGLGSKSVKSRKADFSPVAYMTGQNDGLKFNAKRVLEAT